MRVIELETGTGDFAGHQRVDDDEAVVGLDDRHIRDVDAAQLVDAVGNVKQPGLAVEPRYPPKAWIDRWRRLLGIEEIIVAEAPDDLARGCARDPFGQGRNQATPRVSEIAPVREWQRRPYRRVHCARRRFCVLWRDLWHGSPPPI